MSRRVILLLSFLTFFVFVPKTFAQVVPTQTISLPVTGTSNPSVIAMVPSPQLIELPKTGLPLGALVLVALIPIGWKLRKYRASLFDKTSPSSIWQNRQFKR